VRCRVTSRCLQRAADMNSGVKVNRSKAALQSQLFTNDSISAFGWRTRLLLFGSRQQQATNPVYYLESVTCSGLVLCRGTGSKLVQRLSKQICGVAGRNSLIRTQPITRLVINWAAFGPTTMRLCSWAEAIRLPPRSQSDCGRYLCRRYFESRRMPELLPN